jgi:hypothetical protein
MKCSKPLGLETVRKRGGESLVAVMAWGTPRGAKTKSPTPAGNSWSPTRTITDPSST